eukprot:CAMPEP_0174305662 /NCGR_PEP_ID=MMETSP0809-20121228/61537_1 /TAXON_ID=73025 ORGANISM="Eutreptiella gymnastica-like, Strain CCMP1594" /NCGR_SAMPLE_ID=MMETSP0809 /ASSEMBLY_ACC=CAM_ASM_000658 /LENGTH=194 /DNA_ID=CAMNT_0015412171 /DNA_START=909 /DNA_END=1493 /DNA_ORIENTATION=-
MDTRALKSALQVSLQLRASGVLSAVGCCACAGQGGFGPDSSLRASLRVWTHAWTSSAKLRVEPEEHVHRGHLSSACDVQCLLQVLVDFMGWPREAVPRHTECSWCTAQGTVWTSTTDGALHIATVRSLVEARIPPALGRWPHGLLVGMPLCCTVHAKHVLMFGAPPKTRRYPHPAVPCMAVTEPLPMQAQAVHT